MYGKSRQEFCQRALQLVESDKRYDISVRSTDVRIETDCPQVRRRRLTIAKRYGGCFTSGDPPRRNSPIPSFDYTRVTRTITAPVPWAARMAEPAQPFRRRLVEAGAAKRSC